MRKKLTPEDHARIDKVLEESRLAREQLRTIIERQERRHQAWLERKARRRRFWFLRRAA